MTRALGILLVIALAAALAPEVSRYAAERQLAAATGAVETLVSRPTTGADASRVLAWVAETALGAAPHLRGDWRPGNVAGSALLLAGRAAAALDTYRRALDSGERPEVVLNLGRAYGSLGRRESAAAALLRAGWVSPAVLAGVPAAVRAPLRSEIARLEQRLREGRMTALPPLPLD